MRKFPLRVTDEDSQIDKDWWRMQSAVGEPGSACFLTFRFESNFFAEVG